MLPGSFIPWWWAQSPPLTCWQWHPRMISVSWWLETINWFHRRGPRHFCPWILIKHPARGNEILLAPRLITAAIRYLLGPYTHHLTQSFWGHGQHLTEATTMTQWKNKECRLLEAEPKIENQQEPHLPSGDLPQDVWEIWFMSCPQWFLLVVMFLSYFVSLWYWNRTCASWVGAILPSYVFGPLFTFCFEMGAHQISRDSLKLAILLLQSPKWQGLKTYIPPFSLCVP